MTPLNRGSSHRVPISILRCHTGVLLGVIGVRHPSTALRSVVAAPLNTGSLPSGAASGSTATTLVVFPQGNLVGLLMGKQSLLPMSSTSVQSQVHLSFFLLVLGACALAGFLKP
jgi:hypothetical protein